MKTIAALMTFALLAACSGGLELGGIDEPAETDVHTDSPDPADAMPGTGGSVLNPDGTIVEPTPTDTTTPGVDNLDAPLTYHRDIRPLMERHCVGCHQPGEIGAYDLTDYAAVTAVSGLIRQSVSRLEMPPWAPADGCGDFRHARRLTDAEVSMFVDWIDGGTPEGDAADFVAPNGSTIPDIGEPDLTIAMDAPYRPVPPDGGVDDYRCFIIPLNLEERRSLTGWEFRPSNREVAHHAAFWVMPDTAANRQQLAGLEGEDSRPGYTCFGDARLGAAGGAPIGAWTPGDVPSLMSSGTGFALPQAGFLVLQMHYNTVKDPTGTDQTTVSLRFGPADIETELTVAALFDTNLDIPAGASNVTAGTSMTLPQAVTLYGYLPHMHLIGTRIRLRASNTCLIDIPEWDFNWQGTYFLEAPVTLPAGTRLELECWYDNSMQNQPSGRTPVDVGFGDGTFDEMCGVGIIVGQP